MRLTKDKMKKYLYILMSAVLMVMSAGCSSDDDSDDKENSVISVNFTLQDENDVEKYTFNEGENIVFRIELINNDTVMAVLPSYEDVFSYDVFHVYTSNGKDMGRPYDLFASGSEYHVRIKAKGTRIYLYPWINDPESELNNPDLHILKPDYMAARIMEPRPLPKGDYYSKFKIKLDNNRVVTCQKSFRIE